MYQLHLRQLPGGGKALAAFALILLAFTVQTETIQYVQKSSGYHKPLFLLFVTHSSFLFLLPCYLLILRIATGKPVTYFLEQLCAGLILQADDFISRPAFFRRAARHEQLPTQETEENGARGPSGRHDTFNRIVALTFIVVALMIGLTIPSVSWFLSVPLTSMANITSIYNTFSIWALVLSVAVLGEPWQYRQAFAVLLACCGVGVVAFSSTHGREERAEHAKVPFFSRALVGNILAFVGAVSMASYEVMYKIIGSLPESDEEPAGAAPVAQAEGESTHLNRDLDAHDEPQVDEVNKQSVDLPFGLHAITMTSGIGVATLCLFWIVLLFADIYGFETMELPKQVSTTLWILLSVVCGVLFNGSFTVLLSLWGPVLASVSCLLTTILVQLSDIILGMSFTWLSLLGCLLIVIGFVCLLPHDEA